jgi:adenosylcobyric acid synthase
MNPILLKPQSDTGAQLIVRGRMEGSWSARAYQDRKAALLEVAVASFRKLQSQSDLVLVEGAGSPAEINLRAGDIANMGFARATGTRVALVGDIDRGHVIAALVGAYAVLDEEDRDMISGFIINKFRGDPALFDEGRREIAKRTGWTDLGMAPWLKLAARLPAEDAVVLERTPRRAAGRRVKIVAPRLARIANFDDFDALAREPGVDFAFIPPGQALPGDADLIILPGSKATIGDLAHLRAQGWDIDIAAHVRRGGRVLGVCGGYQMLGRRIADPQGVEGPAGEAQGLGYLDVETVLTGEKTLQAVGGRVLGAAFQGYEIHVGRTVGPDAASDWIVDASGASLGAACANGKIRGAYVHGLFDSGSARSALLAEIGAPSDGLDQDGVIDAALDEIAAILEASLDISALERMAGL